MMKASGHAEPGLRAPFSSTHADQDRQFEEALQRIAGARVLLVEDNEINQQVASELLTSVGLVVDVAADGQVAVAQVAARVADHLPYDLVLMDMQMPVMDGVTASRLIRESLSAQTLPIVAMTANAMQVDRDRCMNAGMNGFVTKPIHPADLWQALLQWIPQREGLGQAPATTPKRADASPSPADAAALDLVKQLQGIPGLEPMQGLQRTGGNADFYLTMLRKMVSAQADAIPRVRQQLEAGDATSAERTAHTLQGVAGNLGAIGLQSSAHALETALREGAPAHALQACMQSADEVLRDLVQALQSAPGFALSAVPINANPAPCDADRQQAMALLAQLKQHLLEDDPTAQAVWDANALSLSRVVTQHHAVREAIEQFDYETALKLLEAPAALETALKTV
jgi:two-component system sensor histidine kinase/response regulator